VTQDRVKNKINRLGGGKREAEQSRGWEGGGRGGDRHVAVAGDEVMNCRHAAVAVRWIWEDGGLWFRSSVSWRPGGTREPRKGGRTRARQQSVWKMLLFRRVAPSYRLAARRRTEWRWAASKRTAGSTRVWEFMRSEGGEWGGEFIKKDRVVSYQAWKSLMAFITN